MLRLSFLGVATTLSLFIAGIGASSRADSNEALELRCAHAAFAAAPDSPDYRQYAPDRKINITHLALDVTPDFDKRTVAGEVTISFQPIAKPLDELRLDGVDLTVLEVKSSARIASHHATDKEITVNFAKALPAGNDATVTIRYTAQPKKGLYFRTPASGYAAGDAHIWTQGETYEARHWFPCFDSPNEKFTSEMTCRVPEGMTVLSNGRQVSSTKDAKTGLNSVRWVQEKPHASYLMALCAGNFKKLEDKHGNVALEFYTPPSDFAEASNSFKGTREMMAFFEKEIGVPYPWAEYKQAVVHDFTAGGMENTTLTILTDRTLHRAETETLTTSAPLVAHELAHQWFGDLVTCKDWSHLWLNEGFATFYALLYLESAQGRDAKLHALLGDLRNITSQSNDTRGIVWRKYSDTREMFNYLAYPKGAWVLHMLRNQLGEEIYRRCIKTYLERNQFGSVTTDDLAKVIEEISGRSYDQFFDQWVYHAHHPELDVTYAWDAKAKQAKVTVKQVQKISEEISLFRFPLTLRFKGKGGVVDRTFEVREKEHDFFVPLKDAPEIVRVDPEFALLAKVNFTPPTAMLYAQIADAKDMIGRVLAAEQLGKKSDAQTIAKLKQALQKDAFHGVRSEAALALKKIHTKEALDALLDSLQQPDARARNAVVEAIAGFHSPLVAEVFERIATKEKNPFIVATAVRGLGNYDRVLVGGALSNALSSFSYRQTIALAAAEAMRIQSSDQWSEMLGETIWRSGGNFTKSGFAALLDAYASVSRSIEGVRKETVREFIKSFLWRSGNERVRLGAIKALGTLGDDAAIPVLEPFAQVSVQAPERREAEAAISKLRGVQKPGDNLKDLRKELLDAEEEQRKLRKEFNELKKKLEAK